MTTLNPAKIKTRALTLLIEHSPCCILSFAAGFIGISALSHNPLLEFGFAIFGAIAGEWIGHRIFHKPAAHKHGHGFIAILRCYSLSIMIGIASWGLHQAVFHEYSDTPPSTESTQP